MWIMRQAGPLPAGVPRDPRAPRFPEMLPHAGAGRRDHAAAGRAARRRRGDPVLRHPRPAAGHGRARRVQPGAAARASDPLRGRRGLAARAGRARGHAVRPRGGAPDSPPAWRPRARSSASRARRSRWRPTWSRAAARSRSPPSRACCSATRARRTGCSAICADTVASYLAEQVKAGAQAAMLFDTWAGLLGPEDVRTFALPYARRVLDGGARSRTGDRRAGAAHLLRRRCRGLDRGLHGNRRRRHRPRLAHGARRRARARRRRRRAAGQPRSDDPARLARAHPAARARRAPRRARPDRR